MIIKIILITAVLVAIFTYWIFYLNTHPSRYHITTRPDEVGIKYSPISFKSRDNINLAGWFIPAQNKEKAPVIIIAHGLGASKSDFIDLAGSLSISGFNVLLFDFRAHGESKGTTCSLGLNEQLDVRAAVDFIYSQKNLENKNIGIYGFSLGGAVGIITAAEDERIKAVVADTSYSDLFEISKDVIKKTYRLPPFPFLNLAGIFYRLTFKKSIKDISPVKYIHRISPRPVLLITSDVDEMTPFYHAEALIKAANTPKELWVIQGASHGGTLSAGGEEYTNKIINYFKLNL